MMLARTFKRFFLSLASIFCWSLFFALPLFAQSSLLPGETYQTNPKVRPIQVTAAVAPQGAPPAPTLISPPNNAVLTSGVVVFEWKQPAHTAAISRFELSLNGSLKFGNIHTTNQETDDYILTVTNGNEYRLALKPDKWLPDGSYTWKVRVIDVNNRGTDSTTWSFLIDSTPPNIVITEIDGKETAISAADPVTIPAEPIEVSHSSPSIHGHTEAGSQVQLTVTLPDGSLLRYTTTADLNGNFSFTLENLPRDRAVRLTFTAVDLAGLSRVLDGIQLIYRPKKIVIPLPPIFPKPIILTIQVWQPGIPKTWISALKELPPPFGPLMVQVLEPQKEEVVTPTKLIEVPIFPVSRYGFLWLFLILGYVVALFLCTRNQWLYFFAYLWQLVKFWTLGSRGVHEWVSGKEFSPLAFYGFTTSWLDEKKRLHLQRFVASPLGTWDVSFVEGRILNVTSEHPIFPFPSPTTLDAVKVKNTPFTQTSLVFRTGQLPTQTPTALFLPAGEKITAITASAQRTGWLLLSTFIPRVILLLTLLCAFWIFWHAKTWLTLLFIGISVWMLIRDVQLSLRKRLEVYAA